MKPQDIDTVHLDTMEGFYKTRVMSGQSCGPILEGVGQGCTERPHSQPMPSVLRTSFLRVKNERNEKDDPYKRFTLTPSLDETYYVLRGGV